MSIFISFCCCFCSIVMEVAALQSVAPSMSIFISFCCCFCSIVVELAALQSVAPSI